MLSAPSFSGTVPPARRATGWRWISNQTWLASPTTLAGMTPSSLAGCLPSGRSCGAKHRRRRHHRRSTCQDGCCHAPTAASLPPRARAGSSRHSLAGLLPHGRSLAQRGGCRSRRSSQVRLGFFLLGLFVGPPRHPPGPSAGPTLLPPSGLAAITPAHTGARCCS